MLKIDEEGDDNDPAYFTFSTAAAARLWLTDYWRQIGRECVYDLYEMPADELFW